MNPTQETRKDTPVISIVITCYKDEGNIAEMHRRLTAVLSVAEPNYEIIFVNDGSPDNSEMILRNIATQDKKVTVILQARNFGAQNAFTAGMEQSLGQAVVIMDGDLQDPPELIHEFIKKWGEGYDVVYGVHKKREASMGKIKPLLYHIFYVILNKISYLNIPEDAGEFSLMDRRVVDIINQMPEKDRLLRGLRAWVGFKQIGIAYVRPERFWGKSNQNWFSISKWARKAIFSFSFAPIELVSRMAILSCCLTIIGATYYIIFYFIKGAPAGFMTLLMIELALGSIILLSLAIVGEYLARIFEEVKSRPKYVIRKILNNHKGNEHC